MKVFSANFAFGDKNPFNSVKFYNGNNYKGKNELMSYPFDYRMPLQANE